MTSLQRPRSLSPSNICYPASPPDFGPSNTPLFITAERQALVRFSRPIWALPDGLLSLASDRMKTATYDSVAADQTLTLGNVTGQVQAETAISAGILTERITAFATPEIAVAAVLAGEVSAYASVVMARRGFLERGPTTG